MREIYLNSIVAVSMALLITSCTASQDGKYRLGDLVNDVTGMNTSGNTQSTSTQSTSRTQSNTTDLAVYIEPMLNDCYPIDIDTMVQQQRQIIVDYKVVGDPNSEGNVLKTAYLKNAVVFGHPITKIERLRGYEWGLNKLYFTDDQFSKLRPAFHNSKNLEFNTSEKSISCSY